MEKGAIVAAGLDEFITEFVVKEVNANHYAFLVTEASSKNVNEVIKKFDLKSYKLFFIKDIFSASETIDEFLKAFQWLKSKQVTDIYIDATNCITVVEMATYVGASLIDLYKEVLEEKVNFHLMYVHSEFEIKPDGVAGEVRGTEELVSLEKPFESLSFVIAFDAIRSFNKNRYTQAQEDFTNLSKNTSGEKNLLYSALSKLSSGYDKWDKMQVSEAITELGQAQELFSKTKSFKIAKIISQHIDKNKRALNNLRDNRAESIVLELYENARRKADNKSFDDALARLYSCIERIIQIRLEVHGILTKSPDYSKLDKMLVEKFRSELGYLPEELELKKASLLLSLLDDPLSNTINSIGYRSLVGLIGLRNMSILAHGTTPIGERNFEAFKERLVEPIFSEFLKNDTINSLEEHKHLRVLDLHEIFPH